MSPGIEYALGAMVCFGIGDLIYKRGAAAGASAHQFLMVQSWVFAPSVVLYSLVTGSLRFVSGSLWGAVAGFFIWIGFYNFAYSLKSGAISINAPIFRLSFVLTAVLAMALLGESVTSWKLAGIGLALGAAWLLLGARPAQHGSQQHETTSSLMRVLTATASVGIGNFIYSLGLRAGATPGSLIILQAAVVVTLATSFARFADGRIRPSTAALRYAPRAAIVLALAFVFMVEGVARIQTSIAVPIAQMGFVVTALLAVALLREPLTARKGIGIATAAAALASLAHG